jgi:hypothetical protein
MKINSLYALSNLPLLIENCADLNIKNRENDTALDIL